MGRTVNYDNLPLKKYYETEYKGHVVKFVYRADTLRVNLEGYQKNCVLVLSVDSDNRYCWEYNYIRDGVRRFRSYSTLKKAVKSIANILIREKNSADRHEKDLEKLFKGELF